jgi:hypothetical protein
MSLFFYGDYEEMLRVRDEILIPKLGYESWANQKGKDPLNNIKSPDGEIFLQYIEPMIQVELSNHSMIDLEGYLRDSAKPYLEELVRLLNPTKILSVSSQDVTSQLKY